ncbi:NAD(P)H oxidoreductase [Streptomyces sp. NPDC047525]|uniref:NAD(P)H oxidoreductase n=1 Tax=Streptomyces sp. NPDC047525 TaxID=3155264 RepID=UPI0033CD4E9F
MSHVLLVTGHPRTDSLTGQLTRHARDRLVREGHTVDLLDLHAEGFDPRMTEADEPDWADRDKTYSDEVHAHMRRVEAADTVIVVFPLWWFGLPALVKGWIDRVWNYGFAYGRSRPRLAGKRMLWLSLVSYEREQFAELGWDETVTRTLRVGVSEFCGIGAGDTSVHFVYDSLKAGEAAFKETDAALDGLDLSRPRPSSPGLSS